MGSQLSQLPETLLGALLIMGGLLGTGLLVLLVLSRALHKPAESLPRVPWIGAEVWREIAPPRMRRPGRHLVQDPELIAARKQDKQRAPSLPPESSPCPPGSAAEHRRRLLSVPGNGEIASAVWPLCCDRLCMLRMRHVDRERLRALEERAGSLDAAYLQSEIELWGRPNDGGWSELLAGVRSGEHSGEGLNVFHCQSCGALYVASCAP